jgi:hypothetical protein
MREFIREYVVPGAVALLAAGATALPMACSLERAGDRIDDAVAGTRRELGAVPDEARKEVARFLAEKAGLEHRLAVLEELQRSRGDLVGTLESVLIRVPEGVGWVDLMATSGQVEMIFEARHPPAAVHLAEEVAAAPEFDLVDLERATGEEQPTERFYLSARHVERPDDDAPDDDD